MDTTAHPLIERLGLVPHPEGGWYRETWRDGALPRAQGTAIHYLLEAGQRSHWHWVDAAELWLWHAGSPLWLGHAALDTGPVIDITLGGDVLAGQQPQAVIPAGHWQSAEAREGWALVSCVVVPGFTFEGFELAARGWAPGQAAG
ncbi:MAG: cupin domain-containing protein [Sphingomonadales bacterium]|nr:cupin domain-containing protein [Sphingomonadales bacterium]